MEIKLFKKERSFKKRGSGLNLMLYWQLAICLLFLSIIFFLVFSYYLFVKVNKEPDLSGNIFGKQAETIKKERIEKVLEYFSERERRSNEIINSPSPISDPSI